MGNLAESNIFEPGIYQIKTTDPVVGGANGVSNIQAKQLANRTGYLKVRADQVDAAAVGHTGLGGRLNKIEADTAALGPDKQNMVAATLMFALDQAAQADWGVRALREQIQQEGELTFINRGIVSGCGAVKNVGDVTIDNGICFVGGNRHPVIGNSLAVPVSTTETLVHKFYLRPGSAASGYVVFLITGAAPDDGILISTIIVPPNVSNLTTATLIDERRLEPMFPVMIEVVAEEYVTINTLQNGDYRFDVEVVAAVGAPCGRDSVVLSSRAANGMTVRLLSAADDVAVRWRVSRLNN